MKCSECGSVIEAGKFHECVRPDLDPVRASVPSVAEDRDAFGWYPISTAPKDGTRIWVYVPRKVTPKGRNFTKHPHMMLTVAWFSRPEDTAARTTSLRAKGLGKLKGGYWSGRNDGLRPLHASPTHWRYLPVPPVGSAPPANPEGSRPPNSSTPEVKEVVERLNKMIPETRIGSTHRHTVQDAADLLERLSQGQADWRDGVIEECAHVADLAKEAADECERTEIDVEARDRHVLRSQVSAKIADAIRSKKDK